MGDLDQARSGPLTAPDDLREQIRASDFSPLSIEISHALAAGQLPEHHEDPFDRVLIAQAQIGQLTIVTRDRRFGDYDVAVVSALPPAPGPYTP